MQDCALFWLSTSDEYIPDRVDQTRGTRKLPSWRGPTELMRLQNPYMMHVLITCTAMHDRYLAAQSHLERTPKESYHWAMALQLFNQEISRDFRVCDRDAIWMAAALLSWIAHFAVETQDPEEVWPLSPSTTSGIPWFPVQKGLRVIWQMSDPHRPDGLFAMQLARMNVSDEERCLGIPPPRSGIDGIPQTDLIEMCELDEWSDATNNPYHTAVRTLSGLLCSPSPNPNSIRFLAFVNTTEPDFEDMLRQRDPRSLLLMAIWYGLIPKSAWWISLRASLECRAIYIYLDRYHANDPHIQKVLAPIREMD